ncbi:MAG TPA: hypothetical protein VNW95_09385 [Mucilaginibacter sp.]|jgi:hypothetical protein|nr:hypothetical protein [Mucilaginibacter sp.]
MNDKIFLLFRLTIATKHKHIQEAIKEVEKAVVLTIPDLPNVKIIKKEILNLHQDTKK